MFSVNHSVYNSENSNTPARERGMTVDKSGQRIRRMFGAIAPKYDRMNHLLSFNIDRYWRYRTVRMAHPNRTDPILDVCTGTGDLALAFWRHTRGAVSIVGADFCPEIAETGEGVNTDRLRKLLSAAGFQVLGASETGDPKARNARGWTEYGEFDKLGHDLQAKLAARIEDQLELLLERVQGLLEAGWRRVRVVTDHGWLLVPGGLPKVQLPKYLAESRWSRCASIKDSSHVEVPVAGWSWNTHERFAYAPGVHCFVAGHEYAHGGASLQECMTPVLTLASTGAPTGVVITVSEVQWVGLRCRVTIQPPAAGLLADLRTKPNDPTSSVAEPKALDADGKAALLVADDSLEGTMASLVVVDASGRVVCKEATTVGGDE